jgi:hypothetical protein
LYYTYIAITDVFETDRKYTEDDWNQTATPTSNPYSYWYISIYLKKYILYIITLIFSMACTDFVIYSKTAAESEAYAMVNHGGCAFSLVSILPGTVLGPHLGGKVNFSHRFLLAFMSKGSAHGQ